MKIKFITEPDFFQIEGIRQIISHEHARRFAVIQLNSEVGFFALSWRSNLIDPVIKQSSSKSAIWIGIDQQVVAICLFTGRILLKLSLFTNLLELIEINSKMIVIAETEVLVFNEDFTLISNHGLPDIVVETQSVGSVLVIHFLSEQSLTLDVQKGELK